MLSSLYLENIAIIKQITVDFPLGFTTITGETGAGKSIVMDALKLLLGGRPERDFIRRHEDKGVVLATFSCLLPSVLSSLDEKGVSPDEEGMLFLERTITKEGKSTAKINARPVSIALLREVASCLLSIHAQEDNSILKEEGSERNILDACIHHKDLLFAYQEAYKQYKAIQKEIEDLTFDEKKKERGIEFLRYQINDIEEVSPIVGEEEKLFEEKIKLKNIEKISKQIGFVYRVLRSQDKGNAVYMTDRCARALESIEEYLPHVSDFATRLEDISSELNDIAEEVYQSLDTRNQNPTEELNRIESRLASLSKLQRKYGTRIEDILALKEESEKKLTHYTTADKQILALKKEEKSQLAVLQDLAGKLHDNRQSAGEELTQKILKVLQELDMPLVRFAVTVASSKDDFDRFGYDKVDFMIGVNAGEDMVSVRNTASGGEMARILLAIKSVIAEHDNIGTMIFDEVDSGVSGKTARKIGYLLKKTAKNRQIFAVTHSAQVASLADTHLLVSKSEKEGRTESKIVALNEEERIEELSRILGGIHVTNAQRQAATDMLQGKMIGI